VYEASYTHGDLETPEVSGALLFLFLINPMIVSDSQQIKYPSTVKLFFIEGD
jgi:hypothetical protein